MKLKVACQLDYESHENAPLILMLRPQNGIGQQIIEEKYFLSPNISFSEYQDVYGNLCQRMIAPLGKLTISTSSIVETQDYVDVNFEANFVPIENLPNEAIIYMLPSRYCESDKLFSLAFEITKDLPMGYAQVDAIRQWVKNNIIYEYGRSSSSTSADRKSTRLNSSHQCLSRMPSSA